MVILNEVSRSFGHRALWSLYLAVWFGLIPKEYSPGGPRKLGRISKKGDRYFFCGCCSGTEPGRCSGRPNSADAPASRSTLCESGRPRFKRVPITTKPHVPWPTSWPRFVSQRFEIRRPMGTRNPDNRRSSIERPSPWPSEPGRKASFDVPLPASALRLIAHHG